MTYYIQETDERIVYSLPRETHYSFTSQLANETFGGYLYAAYLPLQAGPDTLRPAWELTYKITNKDLTNEAWRLLSTIQRTLRMVQQFHVDLSYIPELQAFIADDGSLLFEWIFDDYRIGFSIEPSPQESSWFLITDRNLGEISAYGFISGVDLNTLVLWLLNFILSHS